MELQCDVPATSTDRHTNTTKQTDNGFHGRVGLQGPALPKVFTKEDVSKFLTQHDNNKGITTEQSFRSVTSNTHN